VGYYWVVMEPGVDPEVAYFDGDDWVAVGREETVQPLRVVSGRLEPPGEAS
jgi:hypothetical protein